MTLILQNGNSPNHYESYLGGLKTHGTMVLFLFVPASSKYSRNGRKCSFRTNAQSTLPPRKSHLMDGNSWSTVSGTKYKISQRNILAEMLKVGCLQKQTGIRNSYKTRCFWILWSSAWKLRRLQKKWGKCGLSQRNKHPLSSDFQNPEAMLGVSLCHARGIFPPLAQFTARHQISYCPHEVHLKHPILKSPILPENLS